MMEDYAEHESQIYHPPEIEDDSESEWQYNSDEPDGLFSMLPDELVQSIFQRLDMRSYLLLSLTCRRLYNVCIILSSNDSSQRSFVTYCCFWKQNS